MYVYKFSSKLYMQMPHKSTGGVCATGAKVIIPFSEFCHVYSIKMLILQFCWMQTASCHES